MLSQDAWRRCQTPASINLAELGEEEWEVIRDTEDEQVGARARARGVCVCDNLVHVILSVYE